MPAPAADLRYSTKEEIEHAHKDLRDSFATGITMDVGFRKHQLKQLSFLLNVGRKGHIVTKVCESAYIDIFSFST